MGVVARGTDLGVFDSLPVHVNEEFRGYLGRGQYVTAEVAPGPVVVKSRGPMTKATVLTFDAAPDRAYYVRMRTAGGALARVRLDVVEAGAGAALVAHATPAPPAAER